MNGMSDGPRHYQQPTMPLPQHGAPPPPRRSLWRSPAFVVPVVIAVVLVAGTAGLVVVSKLRGGSADTTATTAGAAPATSSVKAPEGRTWLSGGWPGGSYSANRINAFGAWRGQPEDLVTTYPSYDTWDEMRKSDFHIANFDNFKGRLADGLPLLPNHDDGTLGDVAAGKYDDVFTGIAKTLVQHKREDSFLRIGLEANGTWFPWGATADRAEHYKAAWRHVQGVLKAVSPKFTFVFDITCGKVLEGGSGRLDSLTKLYPGDDVVDIVGCDHYDSYHVKATDAAGWAQALHPKDAAGLADVADFARQHGKKMAVPEWGLTSTAKDGAGDNPAFINYMYQFFEQNKANLAFEAYFNEPMDTVGSSIWDPVQNPKSSKEYARLWGASPLVATSGTASPSS
jgi:hypothetical protein